MIKEIGYSSVKACYGGTGECSCRGTNNPSESIFGVFMKMVENEHECVRWCIGEMKGNEWKFDRGYLYIFGFGKSWHSLQDPNLKID